MKIRFLYSIVLVLFTAQFSAFALDIKINTQQIDSILEASTSQIYENPDETISLGLSIYNNTNYSKKTRTRALMLVTLAFTSKRDYQEALKYVIKADQLSEAIDDKVLQIEILFRTGILYQQLKIFDKSIEYLEKTEQMALLYPNREAVGKYLANSYTVKGFIYKDNLNCDIALEFFDKGIREYQKLKTVDVNTNLSIAYYNKGNCYTLLTEYDKAKNSFNKAITYAELEEANSLIAFAQKGLAAVNTEQGEYQNAIDLLTTALKKSNNVGDVVLNSSIYQGLYENHLALNHWDEYQHFYNLNAETQLQIKTSERNSICDSLEDNSERQNEKIQLLRNRHNVRLKYFFLIVFLIVISVFFLEKKNKRTIKMLKKEVETIQNQKPSA